MAFSEYIHPAETEWTLRDSVLRTSSPRPEPAAPSLAGTPRPPHPGTTPFFFHRVPSLGRILSSVPLGKDARQLTGTLFKAHTSRPSVESPGPSQTGQGDKASLNRTPPSSGPLFPQRPQASSRPRSHSNRTNMAPPARGAHA